MAERNLVVSAGHLLTRGYIAIPTDRRSTRGAPVNALYGVARSLVRALSARAPDRAVAIIGNERRVPSSSLAALTAQAERLVELLGAFGLRVIETDEEAKLVAAYVRAATHEGHDAVIVGSDKRYAQLVGDRVWWHDAYKDARYTPEMVAKRFQVPPAQVADWLALVGDDDAVEGVKGIGKKGATQLLETFGAVESALENLDALDTRTRNALSAAGEAVAGQLAVARLSSAGVPLPVAWDALAYHAADKGALNALFSDLGFFELLAATEPTQAGPRICDRLDAIVEAVDVLMTQPRGSSVAVFGLTEDPSPVRGALTGFGVSVEPKTEFYFALPASSDPDRPRAVAALAGWLEDANKPKVGHETTAVLTAWARQGVTVRGIVGDSAFAGHLTEPSNLAPHELSDLARQVTKRALSSEEAVRGTGRARKRWAKVEPSSAARFACSSAAAAADVWRTLAPSVDERLVHEYLALSETVARMAVRGISVDADRLDQAGADFQRTQLALEQRIFEHAGKSFNLGSAKQLGAVLFDDLGLTVVKRTKTGWSTATEALERIRHEHPIVSLVVDWRALDRMRSTWITALKGCIDADGRVRSTFHIARSFSGRLINSSPDLGRVPGRTEDMQRIRRAFVAPEGTVLVSIDYRQLGLYVLAHLTKDPALVEPLSRNEDMHALTASAVLEVPVEAVTPAQRQMGKVVNFATFAGQGSSALAQQLAVSVPDAKQLIERFDRRYRVVRAFQDEQLRLAREEGYIVTLAGRRWPIGGLESLDPLERSYAERLARRATHEGSVADVSRRGLLEADRALVQAGLRAAPLLQIHDEVLFEMPEDEVEAGVRGVTEAMAHAFALEVPLRVGRKAGANWAELTPLDPSDGAGA